MESVVAYHKRRVSIALVELFPEIGLDLNLLSYEIYLFYFLNLFVIVFNYYWIKCVF